jgi:anaerobic magnesium-protoporphyrin IX monomethyl ester cyclase
MKILLIKAPLFEIKKGLFLPARKKMEMGVQSSYTPPLGLLYLGRTLEDEGHAVEVIDFYCEKEPMKTMDKSLQSADIIGLSLFTNDCSDTAGVAQTIRDKHPNIPIIVGGPHCTSLLDKSLSDVPAADIAIIGDGEYAIIDVIKAVEGKKKLSETPGIYYRDKDKIKKGKPPELVKDLDTLPFPSRHLIDKYDYGKIFNIYFRKPKLTSISTSRGCPFHCRFCTRDFLTRKTYRKRSIENVIKELKEINDKFSSVVIVDDNFLADVKRAEGIMDGIINEGIDLHLCIQGSRVDTAKPELYKKMKKAGVRLIFFGVESGNQKVLDYYNKGITLNQIKDAVNLANEMGFFITGSFILGAPFETETHFEETIKFACSLPFDITIWRRLMYKYGSDIWIKAIEDGKLTKDDGYNIIADSSKGLGNYTKEELADFCNKAYRKFYLRPKYFTQQISKMILKRNLMSIKIGLEYIFSERNL